MADAVAHEATERSADRTRFDLDLISDVEVMPPPGAREVTVEFATTGHGTTVTIATDAGHCYEADVVDGREVRHLAATHGDGRRLVDAGEPWVRAVCEFFGLEIPQDHDDPGVEQHDVVDREAIVPE